MINEAEIELPGTFVVLQGIAGDGLWNTIDSLPIVYEEEEEEFHHVQEQTVVDYDLSSSSDERQPAQQQQQQLLARSPLSTYDPMMAQTNMPPLSLNPLTTTRRRPAAVSQRPLDEASSFIVVSDNNEDRHLDIHSRAEERAVEAWHVSCRLREERQRHDWLGQEIEEDWWQTGGRLAVFEELPTRHFDELTVKATLAPGTTVVATEQISLDGKTFRQCKDGSVQVLRIESPHEGYVAYSVEGWRFLGFGLPSHYVDPETWIWRVTCAAGAFVREGLLLSSKHVATLPYGSFMRVTDKTVNVMGLSRLRVSAKLPESSDRVEGWISEFLNPLSGQRGPIAQPVPFPVPALYRVMLEDGAVIRSDVELSSKQIGHAPEGAVLKIVGRAFSEHPEESCVVRLKLAGNGGWVSVRLNRPAPNDDLVFELVDIDSKFDPDDPGAWHLEAQHDVYQQVQGGENEAELSSIDDDDDDEGPPSETLVETRNILVARNGVVSSHGRVRVDHVKCLICTVAEQNATIVHGETGHIACCLVCARMLRAKGDACPICRLPIDSVIQHFWS